MSKPCKQKIGLVFNYTSVAKAYSDAVMELHEKIGTVNRNEYDRLYGIAEDARISVDAARQEIESHVNMHGC
jgi:hypothetical protein